MVGISRDITERREAEDREELLHSLLRHDLRNKTQIVQGYLELLEDFDLPEEAKKFVEKARKGTREGADLIEKVRILRKAQKGEEVREVGIDKVVHEAVDQVRPMADDRGIEIEVDCPGEGCKVLGGSLLNRVFSNIVENAILHSGCSKIRIHGVSTEGEVMCAIEDDSKGISDDEKDKIFEKGYTTDEERGTGLGMFLVQTLLEIYGGSIKVKDSELGGARFDVHLQKA